MKRFLLLLAAVGLVSCTETLDEGGPNEIQKRFDFSEVDMDNLQGIREERNFNMPGLTVFTGTSNDCVWIGVFDSESGSLKCQYTDEDHPTSYYAYGEEYKYGIGQVVGIYLENKKIVLVIRYSDPQYKNIDRVDLIVADDNKQDRYVIDEKSEVSSASIVKWTSGSIYIVFGEKGIIYDADNDVFLSRAIGTLGRIENDIYHNLIISPENRLHFWKVVNRLGPVTGSKRGFNPDMDPEVHGEDLIIGEYQCTYDAISCTTKYMWIYEPIDENLSEKPRYSFEYKIRTNDHIVFVVTQTEYDGTITTKTVDIRVENDELKVDIQ